MYEGQFKEGDQGKGAMNQLWEVMEGHFREGMLQGKGFIKTITGETYTGDFVDGEYHGLGTIMNQKRGVTPQGPGDGGSGRAEARRPSRTGASMMGIFFDKGRGHYV